MKIVLDTSVIIAAVRSRRGASNGLLVEVARGRARIAISVALFLGYEAVLKRPEHMLAHTMSVTPIDRYLGELANICEPVTANFFWRPVLPDPDDEMVLEAALNASADALVTHNIRDFAPARRLGVSILTPSHALKRIKP